MIPSHHPDSFLLKQFACGDIKDHLAPIVGAHVENCSFCQRQVREYENQLAQVMIECPPASLDFDLNKMFDQVVALETKAALKPLLNNELCFSNKKFDLPTSLIFLKKFMGPWKKKLKRIHFSKIAIAGSINMYFLYFEPGVKIPVHTHSGNEFVYVIAGSFEDGINSFSTGDFANFTHLDSHAPKTEDPEGCLLLVSLESPFHFQKGFSRLLNLFGRWLY